MTIRLAHRPGRRSLGSRVAWSIVLSLVVLVAGWSALWLFARWEAERSFADWIAAESAQGRLWTCPDRAVDGFPLSITLRCNGPTFAEAGNPDFQGRIAALAATAQLYFPTSVTVDLTGPLTIRDRGIESGLQVSWAGAHVVLRGDLPGALNRGHLDASDVTLTLPGRAPTRIGTALIGFQPLPAAAAEFTAEIGDLRDLEADAVFGSAEPIALGVKATLTDLPQRGASLPTLLEEWRRAGGKLDLSRFSFAKGVFSARGTGDVQIDEAHRVAGRLQTHFAGLEPLAARFGIPMAAVKVGGLLSSLLGGKSEAAPAAEPPGLDLPIVLRDGRLFIGPAKTGLVLPPLY